MSGSDAYSYNRFDKYEEKLSEGAKPRDQKKIDASIEKAGKKEKEADAAGDYQEADKQSRRQRAMRNQGKMNEGLASAYASIYQVEEEVVEEGLKHRDAKTGEVVDKAEIGKIYYPHGERQKSSVAKRKEEEKKKLALKKEDLALFSAEEIELLGLTEGCGTKGYQEGGEVKCEKCEGKGCDKCDDKKEDKKESSAKPDYIDADGDGDKEESMKKALKEKGTKKN